MQYLVSAVRLFPGKVLTSLMGVHVEREPSANFLRNFGVSEQHVFLHAYNCCGQHSDPICYVEVHGWATQRSTDLPLSRGPLNLHRIGALGC